mmetsp:Transcript_12671/g.30826  ORF Transcript_12671/g.30826 Transcript_12671/m.30826 type:complete len:260 (-) Transcript_12671:501-1280(-)
MRALFFSLLPAWGVRQNFNSTEVSFGGDLLPPAARPRGGKREQVDQGSVDELEQQVDRSGSSGSLGGSSLAAGGGGGAGAGPAARERERGFMQRTYSRSRGTRASLARADADTIDPDDLDPNDPNVHTYITEHNTTHRVVVRSAFSKFIHNHRMLVIGGAVGFFLLLLCCCIICCCCCGPPPPEPIHEDVEAPAPVIQPVMMMPQMGGIPEHYKTENMQGFQYQNEELNTGGTLYGDPESWNAQNMQGFQYQGEEHNRG